MFILASSPKDRGFDAKNTPFETTYCWILSVLILMAFPFPDDVRIKISTSGRGTTYKNEAKDTAHPC